MPRRYKMFTLQQLLQATRGIILLRTSNGSYSASKQYSARRRIIAAKPKNQSIIKAKQNKVRGDDASSVMARGISINSRTIQPGEVFIAIAGDRFDGHRFINQAIEKHAAGIIISQKKNPSLKTVPSKSLFLSSGSQIQSKPWGRSRIFIVIVF